MRLKRFIRNFNGADGFTVTELLFALGLTAFCCAILTGALVAQSDRYLEDLSRTRIQVNLRGAIDIISMNIRQAGENLDKYFPALTLSVDANGSSRLNLRRNLTSIVLRPCQDAHGGVIFVSDHDSAESACLPVNVADSLSAWTTFRTSHDNQVSIYIYDRVAKSGEFVKYIGEGELDGDDYLTTSGVAGTYPASSSSIFILENYEFSYDDTTKTLQLVVDGDTSNVQDVAYDITSFTSLIKFANGTSASTFQPTDALDWKQIQSVTLALGGEQSWKTRTFTRSLSAEYFPRNVLSH